MNDEIQDSAVKVNILTWNNNTVGGEQVQKVNSGAIQDMIDGIEKSGILTNFMTPLAAIGIALVIAFGGASLINLSMERSVTNEAVTREFIKIVIGVFIIYNCRTFALAIISAGSWVIEKLQLSFTNTSYADSMEYALVNSFIQTIEENNPITEIKSSFATGGRKSCTRTSEPIWEYIQFFFWFYRKWNHPACFIVSYLFCGYRDRSKIRIYTNCDC